jgi:hypothetical protein
MHGNGGNMDRMGLRRTSLSRYNKLDASDELRIPLIPILAILRVVSRFYFIFSMNLSKTFLVFGIGILYCAP